ncbi:acyl-CoA reductase-like NAD-dependent aldehyde dehydrogenase [Thermocatellispora tengchongensis]|uniref:aldehyde dehydrogenase (NAD(+)) n=1 Tax=Thermocatellispora tengchongensis TaxID=1073253 RepID=A0A840PFC3_9ACTN|nr:aldehyde dehydrogenase family protein [Thermocatellispora tengchongensis]MBB5136643.1 acyl-CoA reductase-like NAD-dependent aldehyde dehydrogenase [Thermocatellispora tengchongensis]
MEGLTLIDPCTGEPFAEVPAATAAEVEDAVAGACRARESWSMVPVAERAAVLRRAADELEARTAELAEAITMPLGLPRHLVRATQIASALTTLRTTADAAEELAWEERVGNSLVRREPAGVAAAIAPWNYPLMQSVNKVAPALAAGCAVVLKPSELTPLDSFVLADALAAAGLPGGVLQVVAGTGPEAGEALAGHPAVDVVSFTGSTAVGRRVAALAAGNVARSLLELGGKSASILLDDADVPAAVAHCARTVVGNSGQTCTALTRLLVPRSRLAEAEECAAALVGAARPGHRDDPGADLGPVISARQRERVTGHIRRGAAAGARLLTGGPDAPPGLDRGFYVRPTVFGGVDPGMAIAREEIFGPVLCVIPYEGEEEAVRIADDTPYGLSGAVWSADPERALAVARRLRTGQVSVNGGPFNPLAPFGGVKHSGTGREKGRYGIEEFTEYKAIQLPLTGGGS